MNVSIIEPDGTKRTMTGAIYALDIDVDTNTLKMQVIGIQRDFTFTVTGNVHVTESEVL